jgi:hypothetical protein
MSTGFACAAQEKGTEYTQKTAAFAAALSVHRPDESERKRAERFRLACEF